MSLEVFINTSNLKLNHQSAEIKVTAAELEYPRLVI